MNPMVLFTGNSNPQLSQQVAQHLNIPLGNAHVGRFSDGEVMVEIHENVRGKHTFILQSTCSPCNDHLMELMAMADALRRASATQVTAVVPYFGYARQDRRVRSARVPITAKVVADMFASVGISRVITVELHADQIQGFFSMPVDNAYSSPVFLSDMKEHGYLDSTAVSPDIGGVVRARAIAKRLQHSELAIIDKRRIAPNRSEILHVIGDVSQKNCILIDDIVDTAGTLCQAAAALKDHGAKRIVAYCTHPVLSGAAVDTIERSPLDEMVVCDTIPLSPTAQQSSKIRPISLSKLLAETIHRVHAEESLSTMFEEE